MLNCLCALAIAGSEKRRCNSSHGGARPHPFTVASSLMREVAIRDEMIRLGQFLKLSGLIDSGSDAKHLLAEGWVTVDGIVESRRGRQLSRGMVVELGGDRARVA